jgi:hypothetical protein
MHYWISTPSDENAARMLLDVCLASDAGRFQPFVPEASPINSLRMKFHNSSFRIGCNGLSLYNMGELVRTSKTSTTESS